MVKEKLTDEIFEQKLKKEGDKRVLGQKENDPDRGTSKCKGPRLGKSDVFEEHQGSHWLECEERIVENGDVAKGINHSSPCQP